jgi:hypothetical protein
MAITNAKHIIAEINGERCTIIETGASRERAAFLSELLSLNNLEVRELQEAAKNPGDEPTYTIGVTDLSFNPVFAVYERKLKTPEGDIVSPGYWNQECTECDQRYWLRRKGAKYSED